MRLGHPGARPPVPGKTELEVGDDIVLNDGGPDVDPAGRYSFADVQRRAPLVILAVVFGMTVVAPGRPRGLLALAGICVTVGVLLAFVFPAVLERASPLGVALTGAIGIAVGTINLAHGISDRTAVALVGTIASLSLTASLVAAFGAAAHLSGLAREEALNLLTFAPEHDFPQAPARGDDHWRPGGPRRRDHDPGIHRVGAP